MHETGYSDGGSSTGREERPTAGRFVMGTRQAAVLGLLAGLFLLQQAPARAGVDLWPLLEISEGRTTVLYPFYVHEGNFLMVFPFYYRTNEGKDAHLAWPLVKISEGRLTRFMPVWYGADKESFTFFPLIRQTPDYTFWMIPPIEHWGNGQFFAVYPFYARFQSGYFVFPALYRNKTAQEDVWGFLPFYWRASEGDKRTLWALPYYQKRGGGESCTAVLPFFSRTVAAEAESLWVMPYYQLRAPDEVVTKVWPFFSRSAVGDEESLWLLPYERTRSPQRSSDTVWPVFHRSHDSKGSNLWFLLYYQMQSPDKYCHIFWPLFERSAEGKKKILWTFPYYQERSPEGSTTAVWPIFARTRKDETESRWVIPYYQKRGPQETYTALYPLGGFGRKTVEAAQGKESGRRTTLWMLGPLFRREMEKSAKGEILSYSRRFLAFSDEKERSGRRVFRILGFPVTERMR